MPQPSGEAFLKVYLARFFPAVSDGLTTQNGLCITEIIMVCYRRDCAMVNTYTRLFVKDF